MEDTCFIDNQFFGGGIVALNETVVEGLTNNYVSSNMPSELVCPFAYEEVQGTCVQPDATACAVLGIPTVSTNQTNTTSNDTTTTATTSAEQEQSGACLPRFVSSFALLIVSFAVYL